MSVAPKSKIPDRRLTSKSSLVASILPEKKTKATKKESQKPADRTRSATLITALPLRKPPENITKRQSQPQKKHSSKLNDRTLDILPESETLPGWLRAVLAIQQRSSIVTFLLVTAVLVIYASTVYSQQLWSQKYRQLEMLRRQERQLTAAGEVLKNQLANQAEQPDNGLVSPSPENNLFLEPSTTKPSGEPKTAPKSNSNPKLNSSPIGY